MDYFIKPEVFIKLLKFFLYLGGRMPLFWCIAEKITNNIDNFSLELITI